MNIQIRLIALVTIFFAFTSSSFSQANVGFKQFSLEVSGGLHIPVSPKEGNLSDYIGLEKFQVAGRVMLSEKMGIRGFLSYDHFANKNDKNLGNEYTSLGLEGVMNLGEVLNFSPLFRQNYAVQAHAGLGVASASSDVSSATDKQAFFIIGATGLRKLSSSFALMADLNYVAAFSRDLTYGGVGVPGMTRSGGHLNINFGIVFYLGSQPDHADWWH